MWTNCFIDVNLSSAQESEVACQKSKSAQRGHNWISCSCTGLRSHREALQFFRTDLVFTLSSIKWSFGKNVAFAILCINLDYVILMYLLLQIKFKTCVCVCVWRKRMKRLNFSCVYHRRSSIVLITGLLEKCTCTLFQTYPTLFTTILKKKQLFTQSINL